MSSIIKLSELSTGKEALIMELLNGESTRSRLMELGFYPGAKTQPLYRAPTGDPTAYSVQNALIALRRSEAEKIKVKPL